MDEISVRDKKFITYITAEEIDMVVKRMANTIYEQHKNDVPIFVGVLSGVVMFMSDFLKNYKGACEVSFLQLASYKGIKQGEVESLMGLNIDVTNRHVIILEDIVDTGNTLDNLYKLLETKPVKSLKVATLFFKPDAYKKSLNIGLIGLNIKNKFVVGYGLDYDGLGRNYPNLYQLKE